MSSRLKLLHRLLKHAEQYSAAQAKGVIDNYLIQFKPLAKAIYKSPQPLKQQISTVVNLTKLLLAKNILSAQETESISSAINGIKNSTDRNIVINGLENINASLYRELLNISANLRTPEQAAQKKLEDGAEEYRAMYKMYHDGKSQAGESDWQMWVKENPEPVQAYNKLNKR